jgi:hypothetical protein
MLEMTGIAVQRFTRRNLRLLYDLVDTMGEAMGPQMSEPELSPLYMGPMLHRFQVEKGEGGSRWRRRRSGGR